MAAQDLTSTSAVKSFLQKSDSTQDTIIASLITRASVGIMRYTHRQFAPTESAATKVFAHEGGHMLDLAPYDLRVLTTLTTATETTSPAVVASTNYGLRPKPARDGVYQRVKLTTNPGECEITVVGDWGFATVPEDVAHWCIVTVAMWLRRDVQAFESTFSIDEQRLERPEALPAAVRGGLATWKRPVLP